MCFERSLMTGSAPSRCQTKRKPELVSQLLAPDQQKYDVYVDDLSRKSDMPIDTSMAQQTKMQLLAS